MRTLKLFLLARFNIMSIRRSSWIAHFECHQSASRAVNTIAEKGRREVRGCDNSGMEDGRNKTSKKFLRTRNSTSLLQPLQPIITTPRFLVLAHNSESATLTSTDLRLQVEHSHPHLVDKVSDKRQQPSSWVVFTAKERVSVPRPSHTRDPCPPGSRAPPSPSSRTSADSPEKVPPLRKSVLSSETAMVSLKSRSSLVREHPIEVEKWCGS